MMTTLKKYDVEIIPEKVNSLRRNKKDKSWYIDLNKGNLIEQDIIVICASLGTEKLLKPLGYELKLEPILGQVVEIEYIQKDINHKQWPAVLTIEGFNLISKRENRLLIGSTLEPGNQKSLEAKENMHLMNGKAPSWIKYAPIKNEWLGIRSRPIRQISPILKTLEPGLIINSGHYRNGVLLAPACAEWVGLEIKKYLTINSFQNKLNY